MTIDRIHPVGLFRYPGMAQVVTASGRKSIFVAGQTAMNEKMKVIGGSDYYAQATQAFANLNIALAGAGATFEHLVATTIYIKDIGALAFEEISRAMQVAFQGRPLPDHAMTMIGVAALGSPELLLEVSAVAVI